MSQASAKEIRDKLKNYSDLKIVADVRVSSTKEWVEHKQHSDLVKGWAFLLGASINAVNRTWEVKHRSVIFEPLRFQLYFDEARVYNVSFLSPEDKSLIASAGGTAEEFTNWSNIEGAELSVESYTGFKKAGISTIADFEDIIKLGISLPELNSISESNGTLKDLRLLKENSLSIDNYTSIRQNGGNLLDFVECTKNGCQSLQNYFWSIKTGISLEKYVFLCKMNVSPEDYQTLATNGYSFDEFKQFSEFKPLSVSEFIQLKQSAVSFSTFKQWAPYITDISGYKHAMAFDFADFQEYYSVKALSFEDYVILKQASVPLQTYSEWVPQNAEIQQYPLINSGKANFREYKYFQSFGKNLSTYLSEVNSGWRDSKDYQKFKWDTRHQYLYPARMGSFILFLSGGACVGLGFGLHAISDNYHNNLSVDYVSFLKSPTSNNWNSYKNNYNTYVSTLRASDISFYAAGGFAIISGLTFFIKRDNPHFVATSILNDINFSFSPHGNQFTVCFALKGGAK